LAPTEAGFFCTPLFKRGVSHADRLRASLLSVALRTPAHPAL